MIKKYNKNSDKQYRIIKKFTILPIKIYQYTSQTTWWSWLETTYIYQSWYYSSNMFGGFWKNVRISNQDEYEQYLNEQQNSY